MNNRSAPMRRAGFKSRSWASMPTADRDRPGLLEKAAAFDSLRKEVNLVRRKIIDITPQPQLFPSESGK